MAAYSLIQFLFLIFIPFCTLAQNNGTIPVNSSLTAGEEANPWLSPSGDFGFGFQQLQGEDQFLLSIWYDKIPERTVVWYANVTSPVPRGSRVRLINDVGLELRDPRGQLLWNTGYIPSIIAYGFLNDTGNLVLVGSDNNTNWLWQSFRHPTDTLLPTQELEPGGMLISKRSETNFAQGRFYLRMQETGNLLLSRKSAPSNVDFDGTYFNSLTADAANASNSSTKLVFDGNGYLHILRNNGETSDLSPRSRSIPSASDYYHRVVLNFDGVLTQYYYPRSSSGNQSWTYIWSQPDNICIVINGERGLSACGYNSICSLNNEQRSVCECPTGYSLLDPADTHGGCTPNFSQSCDGARQSYEENLYDIYTHAGVDWPSSDFELLNPSSEEECRTSCLRDCYCSVVIYRNSSCWKKKLPLSNGRIDNRLNSKAFFKYRKSDAPLLNPNSPVSDAPGPDNDRETLNLVLAVLLGSSVFINILVIGAGCLGFFLIYRGNIMKFFEGSNHVETNLRCFTFKELERATNGFKEELGRGAFGIVYKGVVHVGSRTVVAVKRLDRISQDTEKEFRTEVNVIGQTHHKNLVRLIGFCDEGQNRLLVYEYMTNGALSSLLFGDLKPSWSQRTKIAQGVARGLTYLHEECNTQIIHCDIKPQNILLDDYYTARISDFGLAKLLMLNQSRTNTGIRGTKGYVAPEWFRNAKVSAKVDVYSFGVLLLEIITCRRSVENMEMESGEKAILTDWALDCFQEGRLNYLVGDDKEALNNRKELERFVMVGIWCIQEDSSLRPTMRKVSQMLEGVVEVPTPPTPLLFSSSI